MGYYRFIEALLAGRPITVYGDGSQRRANTYVADVVTALLRAEERFTRGSVYNVGGAEEVSALEVIALLEELTRCRAILQHGPTRPGEQARALADTRLASERLGFVPRTSLRDGLAAQLDWQRAGRAAPQTVAVS
jgi:UDP-glucuronate 4-epimerase